MLSFLLSILFSANVYSLDLSVSMLFENSYYFGNTSRTVESYGFMAEMKKRYDFYGFSVSYGGAYSYHSIKSSYTDVDGNISTRSDKLVIENAGLTSVDLLLEFSKKYYKNIFSTTVYFGVASVKYKGIIDTNIYDRRDEGYTYAANIAYGRFLKNNLISKLALMYRGVDDTSPQSFDFLSLLLMFEYRI